MTDSTPVPRHALARLVADYNPFYLLSAMCMLAGVFALNNSLDWSPLPEQNLLYIIGTLNFYELLLIGVGIFLMRRGLTRDATMLFVLEAFFLVDAGFLNSEVFTTDLMLGVAINVVILALAVVKVLAISRGLRLPMFDGRLVMILLQLALLIAIPGILKYASRADAQLHPMTLYAVWWVVGMIPIGHLLSGRSMNPAHRALIGTFMVLPLVSILAHLCTANWVYNVRWYSSNLSPLLLGLAVALGASDNHVRSLELRMRLQLLMPVLALLLTANYPSRLIFELGPVVITPMRLTMLAAALVYFHGLWIHSHPLFGLGGLACLTLTGLGESPAAMTDNVAIATRRSWNLWTRFIPRTATQWGIVSVVSSFILLALGLLVSLRRTPERPSEE